MKNKQKKTKQKGKSVQDLMGIKTFTKNGLKVGKEEFIFYMVQPTNISVLSHTNIEIKVRHLMMVLSAVPDIEITCTDSCECFDTNKSYIKGRIEAEQNEKVRKILNKDLDFLDSIQTETSTARQFLFIARCKSSKSENVLQKANRVEKIISDQGFEVTRMKKADIKRFLAIYFEASMNGDLMPDYDNQINKMAEFFGRMPFALSVGITAYCAVMSVYITVRLHHCRNTDITAMSIKESFDGLPTGLCYFDENGLVVLKNNLMESICLELTGKSLNVAMPFREKIKEASQYENDGAFTVRLKDGRVFSFSLSETEIFSKPYFQLAATDITEFTKLTSTLEYEIGELKKVNAHLKKYNEMVCDLTREEEILRTKEIIHDRLGSTLITTRRYLENGTLSENNGKLLEMWKNNISVLNTAENDCKDENFAKDIENAAKLVGITLETVGNLPTDNNAVARVLTFATMQCLNNAARHAKADKMILESLDDGEKYIFKFANNGRKPPQKINEGGGLSSVRKKAEQIGGSMKISTSEIFVLEITIPKSEVLQYDKSADS